MRRPLLLALLVLLVVPAPASADAPRSPRKERAAAREFGFAAYRLRVALLAQKPEMERRVRAQFEAPECWDLALESAPPQVKAFVTAGHGGITIDAVFGPARPAFVRFLAELERVRTRERALRRGRAVWRKAVRFLSSVPTPPPLCADLLRWQGAGFAPGAVPVYAIDAVAPLGPGSSSQDRRLPRAARRLRALGVKRSAAVRFAGNGLFANLIDDALAEFGQRPMDEDDEELEEGEQEEPEEDEEEEPEDDEIQ